MVSGACWTRDDPNHHFPREGQNPSSTLNQKLYNLIIINNNNKSSIHREVEAFYLFMYLFGKADRTGI